MNALLSISTPENTAGLQAWGESIATLTTPACALFREAWASKFGVGSKAAGKKVSVTALDDKGQPTSKSVVCELRDTLPHEINAGKFKIELNAAAAKALGVKAGAAVSWEFVEQGALK